MFLDTPPTSNTNQSQILQNESTGEMTVKKKKKVALNKILLMQQQTLAMMMRSSNCFQLVKVRVKYSAVFYKDSSHKVPLSNTSKLICEFLPPVSMRRTKVHITSAHRNGERRAERKLNLVSWGEVSFLQSYRFNREVIWILTAWHWESSHRFSPG